MDKVEFCEGDRVIWIGQGEPGEVVEVHGGPCLTISDEDCIEEDKIGIEVRLDVFPDEIYLFEPNELVLDKAV